MILVTITTKNEHPERFESFQKSTDGNDYLYFNEPNKGVVPAMQHLYERFASEDIIAFVHDDVTVHDDSWRERVLREFDNPKVAVVGFGGATGIGTDDLYRTRYQIEQLQRINYASNQTDWETHGSFEDGSKDVAVLDGFFLAVRTSFLREIGGFKWMPFKFHCYDLALCLMAHRKGYKVRMVGVKCTHHGGGTSTTQEYKDWCLENGTTMEREHSEPHKFLYEFFRPELPLRVK